MISWLDGLVFCQAQPSHPQHDEDQATFSYTPLFSSLLYTIEEFRCKSL